MGTGDEWTGCCVRGQGHVAGAETRRWQPASRDGGSSTASEEAEARSQSPAAGAHDAAGCGRGAGLRREACGNREASRLGRRGQDKVLLFGWAVSVMRIRIRPVSDHVSNIREKKKDTLRTRIGGVSDAYPYRIRIRYAIRGPSDVSM